MLSTLRILLVPFVVLALLDGRFRLAFGLFFLAGFSDVLDGLLARRFNWQTRLGSLLDPVADKLMFIGVFATLAYLGLIPLWLAVLVVLRDAIIITGATVYNFTIERLQGAATHLSKLNSLLQGLYVLGILSAQSVGWPGAGLLQLAGIGVALTIAASGAHYVYVWSRRARERGNA